MIQIDNKIYLNLPEQVEKNKKDIEELQQSIGSGTKIYQHIITIAESNEDMGGTFLLISKSSTPINSVATIPVGIVMNGLGMATFNGNKSASAYGIKKEYNGKIDFKGVEINGGAYNETSWTINSPYYEEGYTITDEVVEL